MISYSSVNSNVNSFVDLTHPYISSQLLNFLTAKSSKKKIREKKREKLQWRKSVFLFSVLNKRKINDDVPLCGRLLARSLLRFGLLKRIDRK